MSSSPISAAEVAGGDLAPDDVRRADELQRTDAAFRSDVEAMMQIVGALRSLSPEGWATVAPPPLEIERILGTRRPLRAVRRVAMRPALAGVAAAALLIVGAGIGFALRGGAKDAGSSGESVVLERFATSPLVQRGSVDLPGASGGEVRLRITGAEPTPPGSVEELWLMNDATDLVAVGTFRVAASGTADVRFATAEDPRRYRYVDVSLEPDDGNPAHSGVSVLRSAGR